MRILEEIAEATRKRVGLRKREQPLQTFCSLTETENENAFRFEMALDGEYTGIIAEIKKASPSKGVIAEQFNPHSICAQYERGGAAAVSVLTEPTYFFGSDDALRTVRAACNLPVLRKDFTVDEYQIYEARALGADAVLLIVSLLTDKELKRFLAVADRLGLSCLAETRDREEIARATDCGARIIGVNNRNLSDFSVDTERTAQLARYLPDDVLFVAESGVKTARDVRVLSQAGAAAVLVGEALMRSDDRAALLADFRRAACRRA